MSATEEQVLAAMSVIPQTQHGQQCPVWVRRAEDPPPWAECDCWQMGMARRVADAVAGVSR